MARSVRGITVEISADAKQFNQQMSEVRKDSKNTQLELSALSKALELQYDDQTFQKAQKKAQEAIELSAQHASVLTERLQHLEKIGAVDTTEYRRLQAELAKSETEGLKLQQQLEKINQLKFDNLANEVDNIGKGIEKSGKVISVASGLAVGGLAALSTAGKKAVETADELATTAQKYQITAQELQRLNYIALQTDVTQENVYKSMLKVRNASVDIASGISNNASNALQQLNLDLTNLGDDEKLYAVIGALSEMENETQMLAAANEILGDKLANEVLPMIYAGKDAINEYSSEFDTLGGMTNEQVEKLAAFDNVLNKLKTQLSNITLRIGASLLPIMEQLATLVSDTLVPKLEKLANWFESLSQGQQEFALKALLLVAALGPTIMMIGKLTSATSGLIKMMPKLMQGFSALAAHPVVLIIAAIAALMTILFIKNEAFKNSIMDLVGVLSGVLQPILDALMSIFKPLAEMLGVIGDIFGNLLATQLSIMLNSLTPLFNMFKLLMDLLVPLINVALIPLKINFELLQIPLKVLGSLLGWLGKLFEKFGSFVQVIFDSVLGFVNEVLSWIEDKVNWCIDKINSLIDGVNKSLSWLGVSIGKIDKVTLKIDTGNGIVKAETGSMESETFVYDSVDTTNSNATTYNYDYSNKNTTQHVSVTIQNYAAEVDVDALMNEINIKMAELM